jgi:hypothetical protein
VFKEEGLEYPPEYFVPHLFVALLQHLLPQLGNTAVLDWNGDVTENSDGLHCRHLPDSQ